MIEPKLHIPVLIKETIESLNLKKGDKVIDCTLGTGGHASAILERIIPGGHLLGIDADANAIAIAAARLSIYSQDITLVQGNFTSLGEIASEYGFKPVQGILFDLGLSSLQLDNPDRGFSFQQDGSLDMRFDPTQQLSAYDIVNKTSPDELSHIIQTYGEEPFARRIARSIVAQRPITSTLQLAQNIEKASGSRHRRIHPATRTFQAIRIAVNNELDNLKTGLSQALNILASGGRLAVISYHSLEDRIVKQYFLQEARGCLCPPSAIKCVCGHTPSLRIITRRVIRPEPEEILINPRSRSARLRVAEKL